MGDGYVSGSLGWNSDPVYFSVSDIDELTLDTADIVVTSSVDTTTDIILAEVEVDVDDNVTVKQRHDGYIW